MHGRSWRAISEARRGDGRHQPADGADEGHGLDGTKDARRQLRRIAVLACELDLIGEDARALHVVLEADGEEQRVDAGLDGSSDEHLRLSALVAALREQR